MKNRALSEIGQLALAVVAGVFLTLACAPFNLFPLAPLSAALLIALWVKRTPASAFLRGFCYGLGLFGSGVYWIFISMHSIAELPVLVAALFTGLFIACLALFPACQGWLLNRFFPQDNLTKIACAFPALWVLFEWIRSWLFSGFPWLFIGYSQTHSPLKGYAPLLSIYGVSLFTVMSGALLFYAYQLLRQKKRRQGLYNLLIVSLFWAIGAALCWIPWTTPKGEAIQVSLVQANVQQQMKWLPEQVEPTLELYKTLSQNHWDSQVVIWPEAAIPAPLNDVPDFVDQMAQTARDHHSLFITGIPVKSPENDRYFNAVISVGGTESGYYLKHRLVPFGEYIPLQRWLGRLFDLLQVPMSDLTAGQGQQEPLTLPNGIKMLTFICYEIAFPEQVLYTLKDIGLILTVTNDAWFGHSIAQAQHLQMAEMRALEMGRPVLFASNNGITAMINAQGKLLSAAPPFETYVLTGKIQPYTGKTPWQRYAMDPLLMILFTLLYFAFRQRRAPPQIL